MDIENIRAREQALQGKQLGHERRGPDIIQFSPCMSKPGD